MLDVRQQSLQLASFQKARKAFKGICFIRPPVAFKGDYMFSEMTVRGSSFSENSTPLTTLKWDF